MAVGLLLYLFARLAPVLGPLGLGLFVAALAGPLFGRLEARGLSSVLSLAITVALVVAIGAAIAWRVAARPSRSRRPSEPDERSVTERAGRPPMRGPDLPAVPGP